VCVSTVLGEIMMVAAGLYLLPRDIFDRSYWRSFGSVASAGIAMVFVALALRWMSPYAAAPLSVIAYGSCLWLTGGLDKAQLELLYSVVRRKPAPAAQ
jgi:hypothetical protein